MEARFVICDMGPAHYAGKGFVHFQSWRETYRGLMDDRILDGQSLVLCQAIAEKYPQNTLVALDQDGAVVGFTCYCPYAISDTAPSAYGELSALYVLRKYQGLGLGRRLLEASLARMPRPDVMLYVLEGNDHAVAFYRHVGFRFTGQVKVERVHGAEMRELEMVLHRL